MAERPAVRLRPGRERSLRLGHPWILSGSVATVEGDARPGDVVRVLASDGETLAVGDLDPDSQIRVRIWHFGSDAPDEGDAWIDSRIARAMAWRASHPLLRGTDAVRLVNSEADGLPGLTVDRYASWLAVKLATPAMRRRASQLAQILEMASRAEGAWLRGESSGHESTPARALFGQVPTEPVAIQERGRLYRVDLQRGQKTGFYLDQRDARDLFAELAPGARALDLFAYTGGFSVAAAQGGASSTTAVESSKPACDLLRQNAPLAEIVETDVGKFLRGDAREFDLIALDPPPFARRKRDAPRACRAYKDVNLRALSRAAPGAHLLTFSCSHHVSTELFRKVVLSAAADAGRRVHTLRSLGAPADHPVAAAHPQGEYLKGLLLRVES